MSEPILPSKNVKNRVGEEWGRWRVEEFAGYNKIRQSLWRCVCSCGTHRVFSSGTIAARASQSCGCIRNEWTSRKNTTHGDSGSPEHIVWNGMKERCANPNQNNYPDYGGRGITVCDRWLGPNGFANFLADMGRRPTPKHSIDRRDNAGSYAPENCYWATWKEQRRNQRNPRLRPLTFNGETLLVVEWAERLGIPKNTLFQRLHKGWSVERTLTTPVQIRLSRAAGG